MASPTALAEADIPARIQGFPQIFHVAFGLKRPPQQLSRHPRDRSRRLCEADDAAYLNAVCTRARARRLVHLDRALTTRSIDETLSALKGALAGL